MVELKFRELIWIFLLLISLSCNSRSIHHKIAHQRDPFQLMLEPLSDTNISKLRVTSFTKGKSQMQLEDVFNLSILDSTGDTIFNGPYGTYDTLISFRSESFIIKVSAFKRKDLVLTMNHIPLGSLILLDAFLERGSGKIAYSVQ